MPLSRITSPFQSATANVYSPSANTVAIRTSSADRLFIDSNGLVGVSATPSSEWTSSGLFQINNSSTYSTLSLATTRTVSDGNRIGSIVWEMPNNTATYRSRAEIECDMKGSTANKFGAQIKINVAPDNSTGVSISVTFNQYGMGLGSTVPSSGMGIAFPATQSASSDPNTLDDYEEGTWTPTTGSGVTVNSGTFAAYGSYVKVGRVVTIQMRQYSGTISWNSQAYFSGMPFAPVSGISSAGAAGSYTNDGPSIQGTCLGWASTQIYLAGGANTQTGLIINLTFIVA